MKIPDVNPINYPITITASDIWPVFRPLRIPLRQDVISMRARASICEIYIFGRSINDAHRFSTPFTVPNVCFAVAERANEPVTPADSIVSYGRSGVASEDTVGKDDPI